MSRRVGALTGVWLAGVLLCAGALRIIVDSEHVTDPGATAALALTATLSFITTGVIAIWRRPENRTGRLMVATGFLWLLGALMASDDAWVFTIGFLLGSVAWIAFAWLICAYPTGRLQQRAYAYLVAAVAVVVVLESGALALVDGADEAQACAGDCPESTVAIWHSDAAASAIAAAGMVGAIAVILAALALIVQRWRSATPALRRALGGVMLTSGTTLVLLVAATLVGTVSDRWSRPFEYAALAAFGTVPLAFLAGVLRSRLARSAAGELLMSLGEGVALRDALAAALHDPTLEVGYWVKSQDRYVTSEGDRIDLERPERAVRPVEHDGRPVAVLVHDPTLLDEPELVDAVATAAALWLENERLQADTRAQYRFLETVVNTAPSLLVRVDTSGRILNFNAAVERASGLDDPEQIRGRFFWEVFIDPDEREAMIERFHAAAPEFPPAEYENIFTDARGQQRVIVWSTAPLAGPNGEASGIIAGGLDITERKQKELQLLSSEERLRASIESSPVAIIEVGLDSMIRTWNPAAERIFGWTAEEARSQSLPMVPDHLLPEYEQLVTKVRGGESYTGHETQRRRKDGTLVDVEISSAPIRDAAGSVVGHMVLIVDITQRKRQERALRASDERLRAAIESSPIAVVEVGLDDRVLAWNPAAETIFGWTREEAVGQLVPFVGPEHREEYRRLAEDVRNGKVYSTFETVRRRKDGSLVDVSLSSAPVRDASGAVVSHMALFADIAERKQREVELQGERDFLDKLGDTVPSMIVLTDREGVVLEDGVNLAFRESTRRSTEECSGRSFLDFVHPDDDFPTRMAIAAAANGVERTDVECRWLRADGEPLVVSWSATPIRHPRAGDLVLLSGVDVTVRRGQEEEIRASRARIVAAGDAERRRLERNLHDGAQQRLVSLSLSLRLAEARLTSDADGAQRLLSAARDELGLAIDELRELARGIHPAILTDRGLAAAVEALVGRCPVAVETAVPDERLPPAVEAAAYYVVSESLANVAKYAQATSAAVRVSRNDGVVAVEVADDGVGGADPAGGSGLSGLVDRVAALDGRLVVDSPAGGGTRILAEIPVREPVLSK